MRASGDDQDGSDPGRGAAAARPRTGAEPDLIAEIADIRRSASRLGDLGIAEFADLAAALGAIERDLAGSDPDHPEGLRLREDVKARLDDLGAALRRLLDVVDRLGRRLV